MPNFAAMKRIKASNIEMFDVDAQLDAAFGKEGTPERAMSEERANAFFTTPAVSQTIL